MNLKRWCSALPLLLVWSSLLNPAPAAPPPLANAIPNPDRDLDRRIDEALKKGVDYLLSTKKNDNWESVEHFHGQDVAGAQTALILDSLFQVAHSIDDLRLRPNSPELQASIQWLADHKTDSAFAVSQKALALCHLPLTAELRPAAARAKETLLACLRDDGSVAAAAADPARITPATSSAAEPWDITGAAQVYSALHALDASGLDIPSDTWKSADKWLRAKQLATGSWPASSADAKGSPILTAEGLVVLNLVTGLSAPAGPPPVVPLQDQAIDSAVKKLLAEFDPKSADLAYLDALQQAARTLGLRTINHTDWYRTLAAQILAAQAADGSFSVTATPGDSFGSTDPAVATAHALRFLARGRDPVIFALFNYADHDNHWNARPRAAANLTGWLAHELDKPLNWQSLSLESSPAQWAAAPILLITGSGDPNFSPADLEKLRNFVQSGGLIFSSADNADATFTDRITKKYAPAIFSNRYEMHPLPATHELFSPDLYAKIANPPELLSLSNGIRECWIHSAADIAASWQSHKNSGHDDFLLAANLLRYVTGNGSIRNVLQSLPPPPAAGPTAPTTRTISLARLDYVGNADPEPAAWPRLAAFAPARFHTTLNITTVKPADLDVAKTPVAHMTGTDSFTLTDADILSLKKFLDAGGALLADSGGASPKFTASFTDLMKKLYPVSTPAELPINDPVFNGSLPDSVHLAEIEYRKYAVLKMKERSVRPRIEAITISGRHVILFSPEDITSGLLGTDTWAIHGYTPNSAANLARNLLLYTTAK